MIQFTTLVGDTTTAIPTLNDHLKSNLRSLRRAFIKKDRKLLGYTWVSVTADLDHEGEDIHNTLSAITILASTGVLKPAADKVLPLEKAVEMFPRAMQVSEAMTDVVVVRVIG